MRHSSWREIEKETYADYLKKIEEIKIERNLPEHKSWLGSRVSYHKTEYGLLFTNTQRIEMTTRKDPNSTLYQEADLDEQESMSWRINRSGDRTDDEE